MSKNYIILTIDVVEMLSIFNIYKCDFDCIRLPVFDKLPVGHVVCDATYDFTRHAFLIKVSHDSFDEVEVGMAIPCRPAIIGFKTILRDKDGKFSMETK